MPRLRKFKLQHMMKIPTFATEEAFDAIFITRYDIIRKEYVKIPHEKYFSWEDAKKRAQELNQESESISLEDE